MNPEDITTALTTLAEASRPLAEKGWTLLVQATFADNLSGLIFSLIILSLGTILLLKGRKRDFDYCPGAMLTLLGGFVVFIGLIFFFCCLPQVLYPEAFTLKALLAK